MTIPAECLPVMLDYATVETLCDMALGAVLATNACENCAPDLALNMLDRLWEQAPAVIYRAVMVTVSDRIEGYPYQCATNHFGIFDKPAPAAVDPAVLTHNIQTIHDMVEYMAAAGDTHEDWKRAADVLWATDRSRFRVAVANYVLGYVLDVELVPEGEAEEGHDD